MQKRRYSPAPVHRRSPEVDLLSSIQPRSTQQQQEENNNNYSNKAEKGYPGGVGVGVGAEIPPPNGIRSRKAQGTGMKRGPSAQKNEFAVEGIKEVE